MVNFNDSSSSEDEAMSRLKEATNHQFFSDDLYSKNDSQTSSNKEEPQKTELKSLRKPVDEFKDYRTINVSEEFRTFVAKKLSESLEKNIKYKTKISEQSETKKEEINAGIKLLHSSEHFLTVENEECNLPLKKQKRKNYNTNKKNEPISEADLKQLAVDSSWVLSKKETESWSERKRGKEFKYKKLEDGTLVEQE